MASSQPISQANQVSTNLHNLNLTQQYINAALFNVNNTPNQGYYPRLVNSVPPIINNNEQQTPVLISRQQQLQQQQHQLQQNAINVGTTSSEEIELHMAEKLLENAAQQQKNAFQFDTDTPNRGTNYMSPIKQQLPPTTNTTSSSSAAASPSSKSSSSRGSSSPSSPLSDNKSDKININNSMLDSGIGLLPEVQLRKKPKQQHTVQTEDDESNDEQHNDESQKTPDDNGGFITPPNEGDNPTQNQVKRATVVENPMFSSSPDSELINNPNESLGLDDLDMDYEQIMHYFDNLKVRRCNNRRRRNCKNSS